MVREHLKPLKIDMTVQPTEPGTFATNNGMGLFDMQLTGRGFRHDPSGHFNEFNPASAVFPRWFGEGWKNDELTKAINDGLSTADVAKRKEIYLNIQRILLTDLVHIPVVQPAGVHGRHQAHEEHGAQLHGRRGLCPAGFVGRRLDGAPRPQGG